MSTIILCIIILASGLALGSIFGYIYKRMEPALNVIPILNNGSAPNNQTFATSLWYIEMWFLGFLGICISFFSVHYISDIWFNESLFRNMFTNTFILPGIFILCFLLPYFSVLLHDDRLSHKFLDIIINLFRSLLLLCLPFFIGLGNVYISHFLEVSNNNGLIIFILTFLIIVPLLIISYKKMIDTDSFFVPNALVLYLIYSYMIYADIYFYTLLILLALSLIMHYAGRLKSSENGLVKVLYIVMQSIAVFLIIFISIATTNGIINVGSMGASTPREPMNPNFDRVR